MHDVGVATPVPDIPLPQVPSVGTQGDVEAHTPPLAGGGMFVGEATTDAETTPGETQVLNPPSDDIMLSLGEEATW